MRRSTAAAVGTLTGAALIVGVRLSVSAQVVTAAPPAVDLADSGGSPDPGTSAKPPAKNGKPANPAQQQTADENGGTAGAAQSGLKDGVFRGKASNYAYGTIQVSIKVAGGKITAADASYPVAGNSGAINPNAIAKLKQETLKVKTADDLNAVSGATLTSASYKESLQAALDSAGA
jgi:uncharacterized protein with FMN-binding domain